MKLLVLMVVSLLPPACLGSDFSDSIEGSWTLESAIFDGEPIELIGGHPVTMHLDQGQLTGTAACNSYHGTYRIAGSEFQIVDGVAVTEMACIPEEIMVIERRFLDALLAADQLGIDNGRLNLSGAGAALTFTPTDQSSDDITGGIFGPDTHGSWQLVSGIVGDADIPLVESHPITLEVGAEQVGGTSACNHYGVQFAADGQVLIGGTAMACEPAVMASERAYVAALTRVTDASVEDDHLVATGEGVELTFSGLEPVPVAELVGTRWILESLIQGDVVSSVGGDPATLLLNQDGTFEGSTGCRSIGGEYVAAGAEVVFTSWAADGECPPDLADQDGLVVTVLGDGFRADVAGDVLTMWSRGDEGLIYRADN